MSDREPNYVTASRPVNLRTAQRDQARLERPVSPLVRDRIAAAHARARLGSPLAEQVQSRSATTARLHPMAVAGVLLAAGSGATAVFALIQALPLAAAAAGAGVVAGAMLAWHSQRRSARPDAGGTPALFDDASLRSLDRVLAEMASEIPEGIASQLGDLTRLIVRLSQQAANVDGDFTMDDRLYITECVRRYLPDTLQAYLAIPQGRRNAPLLEGNRSAVELLSQQLDMLRIELEQREVKLAKSAADALLRQQRFLDAKKSA